jgi:hypothetical protein
MAGTYDALDAVISRLAAASWRERDGIKAELGTLAATFADRKDVLEHLEAAKRELRDLEVRWEIDEIIQKLTPPPPAPPPETEKPPEKDKPLSASDLTLLYDDPRGLMLHKTKVGDRWFATQPDPRTGRPQMFELRPEDVTQLKTQLAGSPYWVPGAGA